MTDLKAIKDDLVFGLDIGTRSIVGVVGYLSHQVFHVVAMAEEKHATRAMLDGQIHDIYKVRSDLLLQMFVLQQPDVC